MVDFQGRTEDFEKLNIQIIIASADSLEYANKMKDKVIVTFKIGWGLNAQEVSTKTGAFFDDKKNYIHATGFIINPEGKIVVASYSTGAIGRLTAADTLALILYRMSL